MNQTFSIYSIIRSLTQLKWRTFPGTSQKQKEQAKSYEKMLHDTYGPPPQRTAEEQVQREKDEEAEYLKELTIPLLKQDAKRINSDKDWQKIIRSVHYFPVQFRVKIVGTSHVTSWQSRLEQGIYDSYFVFPSHGSIAYDDIEWLELNASKLSEREIDHFERLLHRINVPKCHMFPFSKQVWRLYGFTEIYDGAVL